MARNQNTIIKVKNAFNGLNRKLDKGEERVSEREDMSIKTSQTEKKKKGGGVRMGEREQNIQEMRYNCKRYL